MHPVLKAPSLLFTLFLSILTPSAAHTSSPNSTYLNPILPGWHSDPSCTHVHGTFFCATSTFIAFPGLPVYASTDLVHWTLASHAWSRESQLPGLSWNTTGQQDGMYAPTLRYRDGEWFLICEYLGQEDGIVGVVFRTSDPFDDDAWSDPVIFHPDTIDPDLFWDDDGKVYTATQGIVLQELDLETGELSQPPISLWNGTGGVWPEGPHLYKKDGWYYLMIAEGGTELDHSITIARSRHITGPYEGYENNPILTNRGTDEYFQTVGHGDLFQDGDGNWWGMCLSTRSGPEWTIYPMGREAVLFPVTWNKGEWPILEPVRGRMSGWPLPHSHHLPALGPLNSADDIYDFPPRTSLPRNLMYWRVPRPGTFTVGKHGGLDIVPSRNNLTGTPLSTTTPELSGEQGLAFIGRRQTHSLFRFSVDLDFDPEGDGQEAGVTVFLTQVNHIDLGIVLLPPEHRSKGDKLQRYLRFRAIGTGTPPAPKLIPIPSSWSSPIRLEITTPNSTAYRLSARPASHPHVKPVVVGDASAELVSGGNGSFVGSLVGAYATCNGAGEGVECPEGGKARVARWRYEGLGQQISEDEVVPV